MSPAGGPRDYYTFISSILDDRLNEHPGWPANIFKLECETYGLYQSTTGDVLADLLDENEIGRIDIEIRSVERPFITRPGITESDIEQNIINATSEFDAFLSNSGYFADLCAYVALCKVHEELNGRLQIDVLPEGPRPHLLNYPGRDPDALILLPSEYVPVEVYNGKDYLGIRSRKYRQLIDLSSFDLVENDDGSVNLTEGGGQPIYPFMINRRSDDIIKTKVRNINGMIVDTDCIIGCEDAHPDIEDTLELFNLTQIVHLLPALETDDGDVLNGSEYNRVTSATGDAGVLRPPANMAAAACELPDQFLDRIRGGLQLQYVNSLYRRFSDPTERMACLVLQTIYNQLLREGGWDRDIALESGWEETTRRYPRIKSAGQRKETILDETLSLINRLVSEGIISEREGGLHARQAWHPQQSLSF